LLPIITIAIATRKKDYHPIVIITRPTAQVYTSFEAKWDGSILLRPYSTSK